MGVLNYLPKLIIRPNEKIYNFSLARLEDSSMRQFGSSRPGVDISSRKREAELWTTYSTKYNVQIFPLQWGERIFFYSDSAFF